VAELPERLHFTFSSSTPSCRCDAEFHGARCDVWRAPVAAEDLRLLRGVEWENCTHGRVAGGTAAPRYPDSFNEARNISDQRLKSNGGVTYMHEAEPAYEFGRGLSYTKFEFSCQTKLLHGVTGQLLQYHPEYYLDHSAERSPLQVPVTVKNTGSRASSVVVLGFVSSNHTGAPRNKELFGYERVADVQPCSQAPASRFRSACLHKCLLWWTCTESSGCFR
jgi:hypothetical protein